MVKQKCMYGHFYDGEKYASCPHCSAGLKKLDSPVFDSIASATETEPPQQKVKKWGWHKNEKTESRTENKSQECISGHWNDGEDGDALTQSVFGDRIPQPIKKPAEPAPMKEPVLTTSENTDVSKRTEEKNHLSDAFAAANVSVNRAVPASHSPAGDDECKTIGFYSFGACQEPPVGYLICIKGEDFGTGFPLKTGNNTIGRSQSMDVQLSDPKVSREKQAVVMYEPKKRRFYLLPGEGNGLCYYQDEIVMSPTIIEPYEKIEIGGSVMILIAVCNDKFSWEDVE